MFRLVLRIASSICCAVCIPAFRTKLVTSWTHRYVSSVSSWLPCWLLVRPLLLLLEELVAIVVVPPAFLVGVVVTTTSGYSNANTVNTSIKRSGFRISAFVNAKSSTSSTTSEGLAVMLVSSGKERRRRREKSLSALFQINGSWVVIPVTASSIHHRHRLYDKPKISCSIYYCTWTGAIYRQKQRIHHTNMVLLPDSTTTSLYAALRCTHSRSRIFRCASLGIQGIEGIFHFLFKIVPPWGARTNRQAYSLLPYRSLLGQSERCPSRLQWE